MARPEVCHVTLSAFVKENQGARVLGYEYKEGQTNAAGAALVRHQAEDLAVNFQVKRLNPTTTVSISIHLQIFPFYLLHQNKQVADIQDEECLSYESILILFACHFIDRPLSKHSSTHPISSRSSLLVREYLHPASAGCVRFHLPRHLLYSV